MMALSMLMAMFLSLLCFMMFLAGHIMIFHFLRVKNKFKVMLFTAVLFFFLYVISFAVIPDNDTVLFSRWTGYVFEAVFFVGFYFFLWYFYFHSLVVADRSISVRMLVEIISSPEKKISLSRIRQRYSLEEKFKDEIRDMVFIDRFNEKNGKYSNAPGASAQAKVFIFLRKFMNLDEREGEE